MNNRQNGRRRGRGGNGGGGNGQRGNLGNPNSGNRIDNRARGNANQLYEKYKNLARDAQMSGDRVNTEYYLQFADHYFRVLSESRARFEEQNPNAPKQRRIQPVDSFDDYGDEDDYADEGEPIRAGEQNGAQGALPNGGGNGAASSERDPGRYGGQRDDGRDPDLGRENRGRENRGREQERGGQRDARRDDYRRDDYRRDGGRRDEPRADDDDRDAARADREDGRVSQDDRYAVTGSPVANDPGEDSPDGSEPTPVAPRRRGRPPRVAAAAPATEAPAAFDADRLPPSLSLTSPPLEEGEAGEPVKPRRRRARSTGSAETTQPG